MAKKHETLTLANVGGNATLKAGKLVLEKGQHAVGLRLKCTVPVNNTTGGALASGLSEARKQALLACFQLASLKYGKGGRQMPFAAVDFARVYREAKKAYQSEIEGYSDSTTGMTRNLPNSATTNVEFYLPIPLGKFAALEGGGFDNVFGMGRSQLQTLTMELKWLSTAIDTNLAVAGTPTFEVIPDTKPCKGDRFCYVPEYSEHDETDKRALLPDGLPLSVHERTAVHASSTLTNFTLMVDGYLHHDQVSAAEAIVEVLDDAKLPSAGLITDKETVLYAVTNSMRLRDVPTGRPLFVQNVKNLSTALLSLYRFPTVAQERVVEDLKEVATNIRKKTIKAVNLADVEGWDLPEHVKAFMPFVLFDKDDSEYERFPGLECVPGADPRVVIPDSVKARAEAQLAEHRANGEALAAEKVEKRLASAIPGAMSNGRGLSKGSGILDSIRNFFR